MLGASPGIPVVVSASDSAKLQGLTICIPLPVDKIITGTGMRRCVQKPEYADLPCSEEKE